MRNNDFPPETSVGPHPEVYSINNFNLIENFNPSLSYLTAKIAASRIIKLSFGYHFFICIRNGPNIISLHPHWWEAAFNKPKREKKGEREREREEA